MPARVLLYVQSLPDGTALVVPVLFPDVAAEASDAVAARRASLGRLRERLAALPAPQRAALRQTRPAHLDRAHVELTIEDEPLAIDVALVVITVDTPGGDVCMVRAPTVPALNLVVRRPEDAPGRAAPKLRALLGQQPPAAVLAAAERGTARLEWVDVELPPPAQPQASGAAQPATNPLQEFGEPMTGTAARLDAREGLVERVLAALATPERSSVLLVGPRDVGKTALVHEIARRLAEGRVPPALAGRELWRVQANDLIAGARYTGMWQDRGRMLVTQTRRTPTIFAMGDPAAILDAGRWSESDNNLGRQLRPAIESGELTIICECTVEGLTACRNKEPSFIDAFHRVDVPEPTPAETQAILEHAAARLGQAQGLTVEAAALPAALDLTRRFEPYRGLPGKAVRLLEETVRSVASVPGRDAVARDDVVRTFTERTGLPRALLSDDVAIRSAAVTDFFEARVLGQPDAVGAVTDLVMVLKAALNDPEKPLGTFLFAGPTGVGKTELAKALAEYLFGSRDRLVRLDMAEYGTADAVQRLAGTTWRSESEGELTRRVREQPFCVVLLDEVEKAHWTAFDALLSVTGEGRLTDAAGRTADFRNAIIVMTTNLGATRQDQTGLGFLADDDAGSAAGRVRQHYVDEAERFFRPEFFNRLDRVVVFNPLQRDTVLRIARREVGRLLLREGIVRRQLLVEVDDAAVDALARRGFHPRYGARPLQREIERAVIQPLARLLVERAPGPGDLVRVRADGGEIRVDLERVTVEPPARPPRPAPAAPQPAPAGAGQAPADGTVARAAAAAGRLADAVRADEDAPAARSLRSELSRLVELTNEPAFWDDAAAARTTMSRIYQVQRVLDDLDRLRERSSGLAELARRMRASRDRQRLPELRQALADVAARADLLRLELAGASAGGAASAALVRATPIGPGGQEWARELVGMYAAWAARTGRDVEPVEDGGSPAVCVAGPASVELLAAEAGLHRRVTREGRAVTARVGVGPAGDADPDGRSPDGPGAVVRVYDEARRTVRDPRTGVLVRDPEAVLGDGRIDAFLLGAVRAV